MEQEQEREASARTETADHDIRNTLASIQDHTRRTLELLRTLVSLLLPELGDREGRPLEDLIATLIVQQREILTIARRTQADVRSLGNRLPRGEGLAGRASPNGAASSC